MVDIVLAVMPMETITSVVCTKLYMFTVTLIVIWLLRLLVGDFLILIHINEKQHELTRVRTRILIFLVLFCLLILL